MTSLKTVLAPACALALCVAPALAVAQTPANAPYLTNVSGIDRRNLDESVRACVDFYQYANRGWLARNTIPADRNSWSAGSELVARNDELLHRILEDAARAGAPRGSVRQKVGDLYASAMDTARTRPAASGRWGR